MVPSSPYSSRKPRIRCCFQKTWLPWAVLIQHCRCQPGWGLTLENSKSCWDLLNPHVHRLVNYVWGHVITRFSSSSVREDGLADFRTNYNMPGHCWIRIRFAAADTTSAHASYRQRCQFLQWRQGTSCHYLQNQYAEKSIYPPTTAVTTTSEHLPGSDFPDKCILGVLTYILQQYKLP